MNVREFAMFFGLMACLLGSFTIFVTRHRARSDTRKRRLDLIAEALRDPGLDPGTRADLLRTLARETDRPLATWLLARLQQRELWRGLWFGAGWLMFVIGGLMFAASSFGLVYGMDRA